MEPGQGLVKERRHPKLGEKIYALLVAPESCAFQESVDDGAVHHVQHGAPADQDNVPIPSLLAVLEHRCRHPWKETKQLILAKNPAD